MATRSGMDLCWDHKSGFPAIECLTEETQRQFQLGVWFYIESC